MAEIRLTVPDTVVEALQEKLGPNVKLTDMARDAMTLFNWAVGERAEGRVILSSEPNLEKPTQIVTQLMSATKPKA